MGALAYADDIVLMSESEEEMNNMLQVVANWAEFMSLELNISKTEVMITLPIGEGESFRKLQIFY